MKTVFPGLSSLSTPTNSTETSCHAGKTAAHLLKITLSTLVFRMRKPIFLSFVVSCFQTLSEQHQVAKRSITDSLG